ncbi:lytic transglycosylase domain-containing protein [Desulfovibrio desulfuricans]|uniref:lytic transglycosylase domain-containing protein n=1 Tax=Desulfovibrio desulfuricans TaxID=876 RepID=UPI0003B383D0|nr:lytic transglycosylase domain-containing protein [Desulfovibrio desulfuricans]
MMKALMLAMAILFFSTLPVRAAESGPPPKLLEAITRQESDLNPLAINVAGKSYLPATREEAERIIQAAQAAGKSFDVGLMQVNSWWMERYGIPPASLLDPEVNATWGKWILAQEIARHGLNWQAVGKYHSPDVERGRRYAWYVYRHYAGQSASNLKEVPHALETPDTQNIPDTGGVRRSPGVSPQGRVITFDVQQAGVSGISRTQPGTSGSPARTAAD